MPSPTSLSQVRADAIARRDRGDLHSARDLLERALEAAVMTSGEDHPEVLTTAHLLASMHRQTGDLAGARRLLENALYAGSSRHGDDNPLLLSISFDLAEIADELGNRHEARKHYMRVARFGPASPGFNQQHVLAARAWLGPNAPAAAGVQSQPVTLPGPEPLTVVAGPVVTPPVEWPPQTTPPPPTTPTLTPTPPSTPPSSPAAPPPSEARHEPRHEARHEARPDTRPDTRPDPLPEAPTQQLRPPATQTPPPAQSPPPPPVQPPTAQPVVPQQPAPQQQPPRHAQQQPPAQAQQPPGYAQQLPQHAQQPPRHAQQQPPPAPPTSPAPAGLQAPTSGAPMGGRPGPFPPAYAPGRPAGPLPVPYQLPPPPKKGRGGLIASILAAVIAFTAAGVTVYFALLRPDGGQTTPNRLPADNVAIDVRDDLVTISWADPSDGQAQPIIVGNREGEGLRRFAVPAKGATSQPLPGLNKNFDYCFRVLLAYTTDDVPQSEQVCTNRKKASPTPRPTPSR